MTGLIRPWSRQGACTGFSLSTTLLWHLLNCVKDFAFPRKIILSHWVPNKSCKAFLPITSRCSMNSARLGKADLSSTTRKIKSTCWRQSLEREFLKFRSVLKDYFYHMKDNPDSLICRFFGLHKVCFADQTGKKRTLFLVIMNNVFKDFNVNEFFDLKGSS